MQYYKVKAGIWDEGPVAFLSDDAFYSFEERGMFMVYDQRNKPSITISADVTDKDIRFFAENTNEPTQNHIHLPMENGPSGWAALVEVRRGDSIHRDHHVRCHLYETLAYWDSNDRFTIPLPCAPHMLPFPNKKDLTPEMIIRDIEARREVAKRLTGREYVSLPDYYLNALTAEQRVRMFSGGHIVQTGEAPE